MSIIRPEGEILTPLEFRAFLELELAKLKKTGEGKIEALDLQTGEKVWLTIDNEQVLCEISGDRLIRVGKERLTGLSVSGFSDVILRPLAENRQAYNITDIFRPFFAGKIKETITAVEQEKVENAEEDEGYPVFRIGFNVGQNSFPSIEDYVDNHYETISTAIDDEIAKLLENGVMFGKVVATGSIRSWPAIRQRLENRLNENGFYFEYLDPVNSFTWIRISVDSFFDER